jgi:signal transduction histidine kinase
LLASAALTQDWIPSAAAGGVAILLSLVVPPGGPGRLAVTVSAMVSVASVLTVYRRYLEQRMSTTLRHNVIIRSQAQGAREAERQRIAADFHDGPLQSFVGFQMRLELIRRLLEKRPEQGMDELRLLQELCKSQVTDLRAFVRSMRPADEGMSLAASLSRMTDSLQRDTGISATFEGEELHDPPEVEISLEILQIVREAFNNIQKHSGATQMKLSAHRRGRNVELAIADNGSGFPFAGAFTLDELDAARMGPVSIKRRIRMLAGELAIESRPGEGATLTFRVPF